jgi:hypothetical protein
VERVVRELVLDLEYVEKAGFWMDVRILIATGLNLFCGIDTRFAARIAGLDRVRQPPADLLQSDSQGTEARRPLEGGPRRERCTPSGDFQSVPAMVEQADQSFQRDLSQLLQSRRGQWVAYHGNDRIGFARTETALYDRCQQMGLCEDEFIVRIIEPELAIQDVRFPESG